MAKGQIIITFDDEHDEVETIKEVLRLVELAYWKIERGGDNAVC